MYITTITPSQLTEILEQLKVPVPDYKDGTAKEETPVTEPVVEDVVPFKIEAESYFYWTTSTFPQHEEQTLVEAFIEDFADMLDKNTIIDLISYNSDDYMAHCYILTHLVFDPEEEENE